MSPISDLVERFSTKDGVPTTWGEAAKLRLKKQGATFRNKYPNGSQVTGSAD
jgi:hypothetical protein